MHDRSGMCGPNIPVPGKVDGLVQRGLHNSVVGLQQHHRWTQNKGETKDS